MLVNGNGEVEVVVVVSGTKSKREGELRGALDELCVVGDPGEQAR